MRIAGSARYRAKSAAVQSEVVWTIYEKQDNGLYLPVWEDHNLQTEYGLTAYAGAWLGGSYTAPQWLVIDSGWSTINSLSGVTLVLADAIHASGDTELVLGLGGSNQETVQFDSSSGTSPCTYTLHTAPTNSHTTGEKVCRNVRESDILSRVQNETEYDATAFPGKRLQTLGSGYSLGTGNFVGQFFLTGTQAIGTFATLGLADSDTVGAGNLHNLLVSGYTHQSGKDLQIDISLTLANA